MSALLRSRRGGGGPGGGPGASLLVSVSPRPLTCRYVRREVRALDAADAALFLDATATLYRVPTAAGLAAFGDAAPRARSRPERSLPKRLTHPGPRPRWRARGGRAARGRVPSLLSHTHTPNLQQNKPAPQMFLALHPNQLCAV